MNLQSSLRYFYRGPGAILVVVLLGLGVCWIIKSGRDKQEAEAAKGQKQRELGQISPKDNVDASEAAKEKILSDRRLVPGNKSEPLTPQPQPAIPAAPPAQARALPTLVSFYSQTSATPAPSPAPQAERPKETQIWLPPSVLIPCALVNTIESSHINTPVIAEVIRDVYQNGHLIIPAGTIVSSFAQAGAVRDRIEVAGVWLFVYPDGRQIRAHAIACDREADVADQQFGIEDGSAGLQGELVESDHWANAKAFVALLLTAATQTGTAAASGALSHGGGGVGVGLPDTTPILSKYLDELLNGQTGDGRFVRVRSSKEFYVVTTETIYPTHRTISDQKLNEESPAPLNSSLSPEVQSAVQAEREIMRGAQPESSPSPERMHY